MQAIQGLHHVTAVARDPQRNIDFYRNVLGQRFVKRTVNFDAPDTYHFYFGDHVGSPGSILTFFAWTNMPRGVRGNGETNALAYKVPKDSLEFWGEHLKKNNVSTNPIETRFGEKVLSFEDPDSMRVELIESESNSSTKFWQDGPIPQEYALQGFHSVTLWVDEFEPTSELLKNQMGYQVAGQEEKRYRFIGDKNVSGHIVDILHRPGKMGANFGAGSIHHIAFRVPNDEAQLEYQSLIRDAGYRITEVMDRNYFHSIYFREHAGILFEIATDTPGFAIDEPVETLGETLKLPAWFEPNRKAIEESLLPITLKAFEK